MSFLSHPKFPNSFHDPFLITSNYTPNYNCIAWAFGDNTKWYWPDPSHIYFWPSGIARTEELSSFVELYSLIGYEICADGRHCNGIEKIAIFTNDNVPTHAARQLNNGKWTSKLGQNIDVCHSISSIEGGEYGYVEIYMQRKSPI